MTDAATPLLSDLREPPKVGHWYMVPVVRYEWHGILDDWPVLGPLHADAEFFGFPHKHYHCDARFLTYRQAQIGVSSLSYELSHLSRPERVAFACLAWPLSDRPDWKDRKGPPTELVPRHRPKLKRLRCSRLGVGVSLGIVGGKGLKATTEMHRHYGDPAPPIRLADGRLLCPHRKADGVVTCPLHGLRVQCGRPRLVLEP
jgi:hypothetical protein